MEHGDEAVVRLTVTNAWSLAGVLHALKTSAAQSTGASSGSGAGQARRGGGASQHARGGGTRVVCSVCLSSEGAHIQWDDETKSLQSQIMVRKDSFSDIYVHHTVEDRRVKFGVGLGQLADTLSLFESELGSSEGLVVSYNPSDEKQLQIETRSVVSLDDVVVAEEGGRGRQQQRGSSAPEDVEVNTYAKIAVQSDPPAYVDWLDAWEGPDTSFHVPSRLLREAVEDLEWPGGSVRLSVTRSPPQVEFVSAGAGALSVKLPESEVSGLHCSADHVCHAYSFRSLRKTLGAQSPQGGLPGLADDGDALTKVSVSAQGTLKVMHMISSSSRGHRGGGDDDGDGSGGVTLYGNTSYFSASAPGGGGNLGRMGIVQYVLLPLAGA
ncbi:hypothetical protein HOP50_08g51410 [Chloropicon primus]|uniref:Checkpoint protein n=3 Tax=Chloropicon primus TaxID=1764295 RepID=A0A5B8MQC0_9CHLO|nr:hypothetical protein A3770_08p51150 [Chloropicon primus]UPR01819.1 hypothetical protein HOP50_08g51410 [Chloropicon primus]|eukprot:QDZ22597.1 hypothetical protein A3770_08p51150 [Chloropicon primus]